MMMMMVKKKRRRAKGKKNKRPPKQKILPGTEKHPWCESWGSRGRNRICHVWIYWVRSEVHGTSSSVSNTGTNAHIVGQSWRNHGTQQTGHWTRIQEVWAEIQLCHSDHGTVSRTLFLHLFLRG